MKPIFGACVVVFFSFVSTAMAGHEIRAQVQPLVTALQLEPLSTVARPLAVRVIDDSAQPIAGVTVWFDIAPCVPAAAAPCPPLTAYGRMDGKSSINVVTDHAGVASIAAFVGGLGEADYDVVAMIPEQAWKDKTLSQRGPAAVIPVHQHIDGADDLALDGIYSSTARDGDGWDVAFGLLGGKLIVVGTWYTFDDGKPLWLLGSGDYDVVGNAVSLELYAASGAQFGSAFDPKAVKRTRWGTARLQWQAGGAMQVTYTRLDGNSGTLSLSRIFPVE